MVKLQEKPLVSVIIPTYNRAQLVRRAIESVLQQTYDHLEMIVVDDASKDNTQEVINGISDLRLRYIRHQTNLGGAISRNTGIDAATGEYLAFLDSDDVWLPEKIADQLATLQNHPHPDQVVSYTQFQITQDDQISIQPSRGIDEGEAIADYLFIHDGEIQTSTMMLSRKLILETRFRPNLKKHQDLDLSLRLAANGAIFLFMEKMLTILDNEERSDRISLISDYRISLKWIEEYQNVISQKATQGFLVKEVVPKLIEREERKLYALKLIIDGVRQNLIPAPKLGLMLRRLLLPKSLRRIWTYLRKQGASKPIN